MPCRSACSSGCCSAAHIYDYIIAIRVLNMHRVGYCNTVQVLVPSRVSDIATEDNYDIAIPTNTCSMFINIPNMPE